MCTDLAVAVMTVLLRNSIQSSGPPDVALLESEFRPSG